MPKIPALNPLNREPELTTPIYGKPHGKPFDGARQRLGRAKTHIRQLDRTIKLFWDRNPYKGVFEPTADGLYEVWKLRGKRRTLPQSFADIATDAIENLHAALDLATFDIGFPLNKDSPAILKDIAFPVSRTEAGFNSQLGKCRKFPKKILAVLRRFEPYHSGQGAAIWALHELANISKHRALTTILCNFRLISVVEIRGFG